MDNKGGLTIALIKMFNDFLTGLQFLTRIYIVKQENWSAENFGHSVKFFPLVGFIIGGIITSIQISFSIYLPTLLGFSLPHHTLVALLLTIMIGLSGGLTCDGFMDTMDGVFSGRSPERMLEIMKDSRVGANGVMAFVLLLIIKYSILLDMPSNALSDALLITPVLGKFSMVVAITVFPYARSEGIGKAFAQYTNTSTLIAAGVFTLFFTIGLGLKAIFSLLAVLIFTLAIAKYISKVLGGLTGDVYGAINELSDVVSLFIMLILA